MSDEPVKECEVCGEPVRRLLFPVAIQFKGSGFYTTDYARRNNLGHTASHAANGSSEPSGSSGASEGGSEGSGSSESGSSPSSASSESAKPVTKLSTPVGATASSGD